MPHVQYTNKTKLVSPSGVLGQHLLITSDSAPVGNHGANQGMTELIHSQSLLSLKVGPHFQSGSPSRLSFYNPPVRPPR